MDRRHRWASALVPTVMARRLWARFEVLPFRYGVTLLAGTIAAAGLLVAGLTLGGGSHEPAARARPGRSPAEAAPPVPTWGAYVPPRRSGPTPVPARPLVTSVPSRTPATHTPSRSNPATACPTSLRKWPWIWEVCRRKPNG
ncbi:hypothetical protein [Actinoallomurus oryzae]